MSGRPPRHPYRSCGGRRAHRRQRTRHRPGRRHHAHRLASLRPRSRRLDPHERRHAAPGARLLRDGTGRRPQAEGHPPTDRDPPRARPEHGEEPLRGGGAPRSDAVHRPQARVAGARRQLAGGGGRARPRRARRRRRRDRQVAPDPRVSPARRHPGRALPSGRLHGPGARQRVPLDSRPGRTDPRFRDRTATGGAACARRYGARHARRHGRRRRAAARTSPRAAARSERDAVGPAARRRAPPSDRGPRRSAARAGPRRSRRARRRGSALGGCVDRRGARRPDAAGPHGTAPGHPLHPSGLRARMVRAAPRAGHGRTVGAGGRARCWSAR